MADRGGAVGTATLYQLARKGWSDVVLVERKELTSGSTVHSAGLAGQLAERLVTETGNPDIAPDGRIELLATYTARPRAAEAL